MAGKFYGIGVGPGDPELITLKGVRALRQVDVIAFPAGRNGKQGIAAAIAAQFFLPHQQLLPLALPFVRDEMVLRAAWQTAAIHIANHLKQDLDVAFITEGDVSFYSTFTYLMWELVEKYPDLDIQIVPGVCSPMAAAATICIPLTIWSDKLAVLPALHRLSDLETALSWAEVVVLMKVSRVYPQVWEVLRSLGLLGQSHIVAWATTPQQQVWSDLTHYSDLSLPYFSLLIVRRSKLALSI